MTSSFSLPWRALAALILGLNITLADVAKPAVDTPVTVDNLDSSACAEWVDGKETPIIGTEKSPAPQPIIWTNKTEPGNRFQVFGDSKNPGTRHMRVGFKAPVEVGSVLVNGGGRLSVLKSTAAYPGDLNREEDWIPAQRLEKGEVSNAEVPTRANAVWSLPPGTMTRALRFTHVAEATDASYAGGVRGIFVSKERWADLAPQAFASASTNAQYAGRVIDRTEDLKRWENLDAKVTTGLDHVPAVSPQNPQWVMLVWPAPVKLEGLDVLDAGFSAAEVQVYVGSPEKHPRDAVASDWKTIRNFEGIKSSSIYLNRLDFKQVVTTRAVRLLVTAPVAEKANLSGATLGGKRVWLGRLFTLQPLENAPLQPVRFAETAAKDEPHAPIPVRFKLEKPGFVTLVIEDESGKRVRNLISETYFPAGENVTWWDGTDDLGRDIDAAKHGLYKIPAQFVAPGKYRVRGLVRGAIEPHYEFSIYCAGYPTWTTVDTTGGWLTNHTPPQAALFVPAAQAPGGKDLIFLGSYVSEGGAGLAWVDLDGRKQGGRGWIGGAWTAAPFLARDAGNNPLPECYAFVGSVWVTEKGSTKAELRITGLTQKGDKQILRYEFDPQDVKKLGMEIGGLAVRDGIAVVSLCRQKQLVFIDVKSGTITEKVPIEDARGIAFDKSGRLLVLNGEKMLYFSMGAGRVAGASTELIPNHLEDPRGLTLDAKGQIYVSEGGASHQVKVFDVSGKFLRAIGKPGAPKAGQYDPLHMNNPTGMAVDPNGRLWVTEKDFLPKRVSVWNPDGTLWKAFYGPAKYGGGGTIDTHDKSRYYYADEGRGAMEFKLDWEKGTYQLERVYYRAQEEDEKLAVRAAAPELALYREGHRYFSNCYNSSPTSGHGTAYLFLDKDGIARPVAAMGRANSWDLLKTAPFASRVPEGVDFNKKDPKLSSALFVWSDLNGDGQVQPEEVNFLAGVSGGITTMPDLSFCVSRINEKAMRFTPTGFTPQGAPLYDLSKGEVLAEGVQGPASSGGDQVLVGSDGWTVATLGISPFPRHSVSGAKNGQPMWSYPNLWPGLHASHEAPKPDRPGELVGPTRLLGGLITPKGSDVGEVWGVNANMGTVYFFTSDGLFVATVFKDKRMGKTWAMPVAERNMNLEEYTLHEENFWPTLSQAPDGSVYLMNGSRAALIRLDGFETLRRLPAAPLQVTAEDLQKSQAYLLALEARRQQDQGRGVLEIALQANAPVVDGKMNEWTSAAWVEIDKSGVGANFNSKSKPYDVTGALAISGDRLYAAYRTNDPKLLANSGAVPTAPFKTGGALDLMLGVNSAADPKRNVPVEGDLRLIVTQVKGKVMAVLYRPVVPGTKDKVPFSSPWRTITIDRVDDVSSQVQLAGSDGNYEFSIPLATLGLKPQVGQNLKGDIGILRGDGAETMGRVYWSNKASGITSDVPSEATLSPQLWGSVQFKNAQ